MKTKILLVPLWAVLTLYSINSNAQTGITRYGDFALSNNSTIFTAGDYNSAFGYFALYKNTSGSYNTGTGARTLYNSNGNYNTASGAYALFNNTIGLNNTAIGAYSMYINNTSNNTAVGYYSLYSNTGGSGNTALGYKSLYSNKAYDNTATGYWALLNNTTGENNTANGKLALQNNTTGTGNAATGSSSLLSNITGSYNTVLGYGANVSSGNLTNATAIGYNAVVNASNKVCIGNTAVTSIGGQVGWGTFSDGRYKKDIKENVAGLAFINSLRPITYTVNVKGLNEYYNKERKQVSDDAVSNNKNEAVEAAMRKAEDVAGKIVYSGFVAQEVEAAAKKLDYKFSGVDKPNTEDGVYGLRYGDFVVPLIKAVQELSKMSDELKIQNDTQQKDINELKALVLSNNQNNKFSQSDSKLSGVSLAQNVPNPFTTTTTIRYKVPAGTNAQILIYDASGKEVKKMQANESGQAQINAYELKAGTYTYPLAINGKVVASKK